MEEENKGSTELSVNPITDGLGLSTLEARFVLFYVGDAHFNGTRAARMAGYDTEKGTSLANIASQNLDKPHVQKALQRAFEQVGVTRAETLFHFADIIRNADVRNFIEPYEWIDGSSNKRKDWRISLLDEDGNVKPGTHLIQSITTDKDGRTTVKMYSRLEANDKMAKALALYGEGANLTQNNYTMNLSPDAVRNIALDMREFERQLAAGEIPDIIDVTPQDMQPE